MRKGNVKDRDLISVQTYLMSIGELCRFLTDSIQKPFLLITHSILNNTIPNSNFNLKFQKGGGTNHPLTLLREKFSCPGS